MHGTVSDFGAVVVRNRGPDLVAFDCIAADCLDLYPDRELFGKSPELLIGHRDSGQSGNCSVEPVGSTVAAPY